VPNWISFIKNVKVENALIVLCGNKLDLERYKKYFLKKLYIFIYIYIIPARQVPAADAEKLAKKEGLLFFEVCAKTNQNILQMFYSAVVELPFFEQFEINNKQALIEQISKYIFIKMIILYSE